MHAQHEKQKKKSRCRVKHMTHCKVVNKKKMFRRLLSSLTLTDYEDDGVSHVYDLNVITRERYFGEGRNLNLEQNSSCCVSLKPTLSYYIIT